MHNKNPSPRHELVDNNRNALVFRATGFAYLVSTAYTPATFPVVSALAAAPVAVPPVAAPANVPCEGMRVSGDQDACQNEAQGNKWKVGW